MKIANELVIAALAGCLVVALASQVLAQAQDNRARDAAIAKCVKWAHTQHPNDADEDQAARTAAYKACMTQAGFTP